MPSLLCVYHAKAPGYVRTKRSVNLLNLIKYGGQIYPHRALNSTCTSGLCKGSFEALKLRFMLREVLVLEPHQCRSGSKERGAAWTTIAENLKAFDMKFSQRSVRERFEKIIKEFKAKEARASGVDVEYTELDKLLTDIVEKMEEFEEAMEKVKGNEKKDRESAEEMRKRAVEQLGETRQ